MATRYQTHHSSSDSLSCADLNLSTATSVWSASDNQDFSMAPSILDTPLLDRTGHRQINKCVSRAVCQVFASPQPLTPRRLTFGEDFSMLVTDMNVLNISSVCSSEFLDDEPRSDLLNEATFDFDNLQDEDMSTYHIADSGYQSVFSPTESIQEPLGERPACVGQDDPTPKPDRSRSHLPHDRRDRCDMTMSSAASDATDFMERPLTRRPVTHKEKNSRRRAIAKSLMRVGRRLRCGGDKTMKTLGVV